MQKILWFDTETTGTDYNKNAIIQLSGLVELVQEGEKKAVVMILII